MATGYADISYGSQFTAKYDGECVQCRDQIEAGTKIVRHPFRGGYAHAICPAKEVPTTN